MNSISVLDCTLRDGGYCNQWKFGFENSKKIVSGLIDANIDIIECGFVTNRCEDNPEITKFRTFDQIAKIIPSNRENKIFVAMINYGEYEIDDIPLCDGSSVDGIRVAFHKKDVEKALQFCRDIKSKGYLVFIQAMVSLNYTDVEFLELITKCNQFSPFAFYIVDSFGMMKSKDLIRLFYMVEHNLHPDISIGFHSHNNMQLSFSNAQVLMGIQTNRNIIIDSSIYGMGRGAGNLNTELFISYLNDNYNTEYKLKPLLIIIDEILDFFYQSNFWGYSLPNYISAIHNVHPNYASYLTDKNTLTVEAIDSIFGMMDEDKKVSFDKSYIEKIYIQYMAIGKLKKENSQELSKIVKGKKILLIAPGKSSYDECEKIAEFCSQNDIITVSVNFLYKYVDVDFVFFSNLRRYNDWEKNDSQKCIVTSNISVDDDCFQVSYKELLNDDESVCDNAGLMAANLFIQLGASEIFLAGFDGYSHDITENYGDQKLSIYTKNVKLDSMNIGMSKVLTEFSRRIHLSFLTNSKYVEISEL